MLIILILLSIAFILLFIFKKDKNQDKKPKMEVSEIKPEVIENSVEKSSIEDLIKEFIVTNPKLINAVERKIESNSRLESELYNFLLNKNYQFEKKDLKDVYEKLKKSIWGYGVLQGLIDDEDISDIKIINKDTVRIKRLGERQTANNIKFKSDKELIEYINFVAIKNGITLSEVNAIQRVTDKTPEKFILRIDISSEYVNSVDFPYLHIRKIPKNKYLLDDLRIKKHMINMDIQNYLQTAMQSDLGILLCGKGGAGKTFLMNALLEEIPHGKAGLVVQEAEELFSYNHPDLMFQMVKSSKGEGNISYTLADLVKNGLVADVDYMIIGEIKGKEAWDLINAAYTGHVPMASIHSINAEESINKLVHYMKYSTSARDMDESELLKTLTGFDVLIFMKDFKTMEITEIAGYEDGEIKFNPVFRYNIEKNKFERLNSSCNKVIKKINYNMIKNKRVVNM